MQGGSDPFSSPQPFAGAGPSAPPPLSLTPDAAALALLAQHAAARAAEAAAEASARKAARDAAAAEAPLEAVRAIGGGAVDANAAGKVERERSAACFVSVGAA